MAKLAESHGFSPLIETERGECTPEARRLFSEIDNFLCRADALERKAFRPVIHISAIDMAVNFWIPEALARSELFSKGENDAQPLFDIRIEVREWWQVLQDVREGIASFGICTQMPHGAGVVATPLLDRPHVLLVSSNHALATLPENTTKIEIHKLTGERVATIHDFVAPINVPEYLRIGGARDMSYIYTNNSAQLLSFVRQNIAVAIITADAVPLDGSIRAFGLRTNVEPLIPARDAIYKMKPSSKRVEPEKMFAFSDVSEALCECIVDYWNDARKWLDGQHRHLDLMWQPEDAEIKTSIHKDSIMAMQRRLGGHPAS